MTMFGLFISAVGSIELPINGNERAAVITNIKLATQQGTYGPFRPPLRVKVPLWLAITLKKKQKCSIQPPDWMDVGKGVLLVFMKCNKPNSKV